MSIQHQRARRLAALLVSALCLACAVYRHAEVSSSAQATRPVLVSEPDSTRAVALESVSRLHEPFGLTARHAFGPDRRTRIQIFVLNLERGDGAANITADAEDGARRVHALPVEHVGPVPGERWIQSVTLRLPDELRAVIAQAATAAVALNRAVTVAVTDKEGNVLGVFTMTGAPAVLEFC